MRPPTDEEQAQQLILEMESFYSEALLGFDEDDLFYEGLLEDFIEIPEGMVATIPSTARAVVDEAVDNTMPQDFHVVYPPRSLSKKAEENADLVRQSVRSMWHHWRTRGADIDPVRDFVKNLAKSGKACFKLAPDWDLWPTLSDEAIDGLRKDEKKLRSVIEDVKRVRQENFPLFLRSIAPQCILEDPTVGTRKLWVIERYEASIAEVQRIFSHDIEELTEYNWGHVVPIHEIWTASHVDRDGNWHQGRRFVFVDFAMRIDEENPYDELPYVIKYSGFGRESYESKPEHKAVGFFTRQNKSLFLAEARRFMHFDAIMSNLAWPIAFVPDKVNLDDLDFSPGAVNPVPSEMYEFIQNVWVTPDIPQPEYLNSLSAIGAQIDRGTVQRPLRGAGVPGTDSAAQYGMIASQSKLRIEPLIQATEQAMSRVSSMALKFIDLEFGDDVSIFAPEAETPKHTLGPKNIDGHYQVFIKFKPNEEQERERKLVLASDAMAKGGLSPYDAYVYAGFDNPSEMVARRKLYEVLEEPMVKRAMAKMLLDEWGVNADELEMQEQINEGMKQVALNEVMNMLQMGTMRNVGDPMSPNGVPPPAQPPGDMQPAGMSMPQGNPGMAQGQVAAMAGDINALGSI